jgi:hypothetical protein
MLDETLAERKIETLERERSNTAMRELIRKIGVPFIF